MSIHYRLIVKHETRKKLLAIVQEKLEDLRYYEEDFDPTYRVYRKLAQPRRSSDTTDRFNLSPCEHNQLLELVTDAKSSVVESSDPYLSMMRLYLQVLDAKSYSNS